MEEKEKISTSFNRAPKKQPKLTKVIAIISAFGLVFLAGIGVGNGQISFSGNQSRQTAGLPPNLSYSSVEKVYDLLRKQYDGTLDEAKLLDGLKSGLVEAAGDPYTEYLTAEQAREFDEELNGTFSGIGAELGKDGQNIVIVAPIKGFPAEKAGLKARDVVIEINEETAHGLSVSEAVQKIRGEAGTQVKLKVLRNNSETLDFTITRDNISIPSVESSIEGGIGYLKISRFSDDTAALSRQAAESFKQAGVKAVILDVRGNPGGLLDSAVSVSSLWLTGSQKVLEEKRDGIVIKTYYARDNPVLQLIPTVVMIDGGSASASEIVAGALKDNGAATLLGDKSFGKGSVQSIERLPDGSALKVTIARWFTPKGRNIDKEGIEPDKKVEQTNSSISDVQLDAAKRELQK